MRVASILSRVTTAALAVLAFGLTATPAVAADSQAAATDLRTWEGPAVG